MRITGVNVNMISLGGLALSAGMNVDGSVVVDGKHFRHFGEARAKAADGEERPRVRHAVDEVRSAAASPRRSPRSSSSCR